MTRTARFPVEGGRAPRATAEAAERPFTGRLAALLAAASLLPFLAGCATTVHPPATPAEPVEVYLLDHGRTSSVVLPVDDDALVRYAYGDWRWYALGETSPARAVAALFWPTRGALGRESIAGPPSEAAVRAGVGAEIDALHPLRVGRAGVAALAARLDAMFERRLDTLVVRETSGLAFVHHPVPYTALHSSNRVVAGWLRELGCRVRGPALLSRWRVGPAAGPAEPSATIPSD